MLLQNGLHIAVLGSDSVVKLFNRFTLTLENAVRCNHDFDVNAMAFNQSGELLVTCRCICAHPALLLFFLILNCLQMIASFLYFFIGVDAGTTSQLQLL